jgi:RimJ/RimL family protein N-acetyltransferase
LFFVFEIAGVPAGTVHFAEFDRTAGVTHWGFYVDPSRPGFGLGTAMAYLALSRAFDELGFRKVIAKVIKFNERSIAFHRNLGFRLTGAYRDSRTEDRGGVLVFDLYDVDWHACRGEVRRRLIDRRPEFAWLT